VRFEFETNKCRSNKLCVCRGANYVNNINLNCIKQIYVCMCIYCECDGMQKCKKSIRNCNPNHIWASQDNFTSFTYLLSHDYIVAPSHSLYLGCVWVYWTINKFHSCVSAVRRRASAAQKNKIIGEFTVSHTHTNMYNAKGV
jgi:hypothetical protein